MLELREYANEGGKLIVDGRNVHQPFTSTSASLSATGPYTWTPDKLFGFYYPPNNEGDDDLPGTAWQRSRTIVQRHVAELPRRRRPPGRRRRRRARSSTAAPGDAGQGRRLFDGMTTVHGQRRARATTRPRTPTARRCRSQVAAAPAQLDQRLAPTSRCARSGARPTTPPTPAQNANGGAIISTRDAVTFGFGLEQVDAGHAQRARRRSPGAPAADRRPTPRAPTIVGYKYPTEPLDRHAARPGRARADGVRRARRHGLRRPARPTASSSRRTEVYPFQFRYTPPASAVGTVVTLTAEAVDVGRQQVHA